MENIDNKPQDADKLTIPARVQDITLMAEQLELMEDYTGLCNCLARAEKCSTSEDIDAEVACGAREIERRTSAASDRLGKIAQMPGFTGPSAERQSRRFSDMDFFLTNPDAALTSHRNMALSAMAAASARVLVAWNMAGVMSVSILDRLRLTAVLLKPQVDHLAVRVATRRRELAEAYPHLASEMGVIELDGVNDSTTKWVLRGPRA
jgi:hypothetical protein